MKFEKKHFFYVGIALAISLLILLLNNFTILFVNFELLSLDQMFYMRNNKPIKVNNVIQKNPRLKEDIVIVGIDEDAIREFGRWPWQRTVHAKLLQRIAPAKPEAIFFDIFFTEYSEPKIDSQFFESVKSFSSTHNNIFFDFPFERKGEEIEMSLIKDRLQLLNRLSVPVTPEAKFLKNYNYAAIPVPEILKTAKGVGNAVIEEDPDSKYRKMPLFIKFNGRLYPQVVTLIALHYYEVPLKNVEIKIGQYVKFKNAKIKTPVKDEFGDVVGYKAKINDITIPVDNECKMLINYCGWPGEFIAQSQYLSYADVFKVPPEFFNNKILFIGMYAQGMAHDIWPSPHGTMYGIEHNANALNTIIKHDFLSYVPNLINTVVIIFIALLLGITVPRMKIWQSGLLVLFIIVALFFIAVFVVFSTYNKVMLLVTPIIATVLTFIGILLYRILTEEKEKKFIKSRFANYVSSTVVEELLKNPKALRLGGEDRIISVFFSDVRSFTTISEQLGEPQKLVALLNEYLSAMTEIILQYDGTLDKYVGDEIMAFWGAPVPHPDHALLACKAALAQIKYLNEVLHKKWKEEGKPQLRIGIGINTGKMTVGNMGSKSRMDYTLMGDEVNLGSRLEGTNKIYKTSIIISEATYNMVKDKVVARELDIIRVKGKSKPVRIYELMDLKDEEIDITSLLPEKNE